VRNAYIKFRTPKDSALGFSELVPHLHFSRLSNDIYCIPWDGVELLNSREIGYSFATEDDLVHARPLWNLSDGK
jgi:hypothetical protein